MNIFTVNVGCAVHSPSKHCLYHLEREEHGVIDGEGAGEAKESHVEDADDESHAPPVLVRDVARGRQHQQRAYVVECAGQSTEPFLASQVKLQEDGALNQ